MDNINMVKLAEQLKQLDAALKQITVVQHSNHGLIKIQLNGRQEVLTMRIDPRYSVGSKQLAQEVKTVFNEALKRSKEQARQETMKIIGVDISAWGDFFKA